MMIKSSLLAVVGSLAESKFAAKDTAGPAGQSSLFGLTPMILIGTGFWITMHGFTVVGKARTKYMELAKKDGEKDVDERYALPNLYAQGTSKHAKAFNCVQRSHQHIFEGYSQVCLAALISAVSYPITAAVCTAMYAVGRYKITQGYAAAEGDPSKRYASPLAIAMWYGMLALYMLGTLSSAKMIIGDKMW
jgi:MAPEG family